MWATLSDTACRDPMQDSITTSLSGPVCNCNHRGLDQQFHRMSPNGSSLSLDLSPGWFRSTLHSLWSWMIFLSVVPQDARCRSFQGCSSDFDSVLERCYQVAGGGTRRAFRLYKPQCATLAYRVAHVMEDDTFYILYVYCHNIADGRSGVALTEQLVERLNINVCLFWWFNTCE